MPLPIKSLFLDIGGVLLTNGWDRHARHKAAERFNLDEEEMNERHHLSFDTYEEGKLSLDEYLSRVIFYRERPFTRGMFKAFMLAQSQPYPETMKLIRELKGRYRLKTVAVSNEGRDLTQYRIQKFGLGDFIDFFIVSCFVHYRKPDADLYRMALDAAQVSPDQVVYIEDRPLFVEVARGLGLQALVHTDCKSTQTALEKWGLSLK